MERYPLNASTLFLEISTGLEQLLSLYQQALETGEKLILMETEKLVPLTDQRHRILQRSENLMTILKRSLEDFERSASQKEKAWIREQKSRIFDLVPKVVAQDRKLAIHFSRRLKECRDEISGHGKRTKGIKAYINSPGSRPWIH
jgi:hypothetical protein